MDLKKKHQILSVKSYLTASTQPKKLILLEATIIGLIGLELYSTGAVTVQQTHYAQCHRTHLLI